MRKDELAVLEALCMASQALGEPVSEYEAGELETLGLEYPSRAFVARVGESLESLVRWGYAHKGRPASLGVVYWPSQSTETDMTFYKVGKIESRDGVFRNLEWLRATPYKTPGVFYPQ